MAPSFRTRWAVYADSYSEWRLCTQSLRSCLPGWGKITSTAAQHQGDAFPPLWQTVAFWQAANVAGTGPHK